jgi:hypothetical protein
MSDPFKKPKKAAPQEAAEIVSEAAEVKAVQVAQPVPIKVEGLSKQEAKTYIAEQFKAGKVVWVIALVAGEHPRSGSWKKPGEKFKLEKAEAYSHRWMKLA